MYDNYVLIASDSNLRLFELNSEKVCKTFSGRFNPDQGRLSGNFSPCGTFVYANTLESRHGSQKAQTEDREEDSTLTAGVLIWRLHSGKLEQREMAAMNSSGLEVDGKPIEPSQVIAARW
jgi:hypothetical protein